MNHICRSNSNKIKKAYFATSENASTSFPLQALTISLMMCFGANSNALPVGGVISAGSASISQGASSTTITQSTQNAAINWQSFSIAQSEAVQFVQPNSNSIALNRVLGADPSNILGLLSSNGKVFLLNPNGILFGKGAQVNVGGLVASTLNITDSDFMAGAYHFIGTSYGKVLNQGAIMTNEDGGYVALLGANVGNDGVISAKLGTVALAAGTAITLDLAGDGLLNVAVNQGAVNALVQNGGMIQSDGGQVLLTAQAAGNLLHSMVSNTGVIEAQTIENHNGTIKLLADMQSGSVSVGGTLSAQGGTNSGDGGFIETSASHVLIADSARVETLAPQGKTGLWLLDPVNYTIAATGGDETPTSVTASLATSNRLISASNDITVASPLTLTSVQTLTLNAGHDVIINAAMTAVPAGAGIVLTAGNDVNISAALTATAAGSSITINAGLDVITTAAITASAAGTSINMTAGRDITTSAAIVATAAGTAIDMSAGRNVSVAVVTADGGGIISLRANNNVVANAAISASTGAVSLIADNDGSGPGAAGGTVTLIGTVTAPSTTIRFNPNGYANTSAEIAAYIAKVTGAVDAKAWLFARANNKTYNGTNAAIMSFAGVPSAGGDVTMIPGTATFDTRNVGTGKSVTFNGASISGADSGKFALFAGSGATTADITTRVLTMTSGNKIYDGTTNAPIVADNRIVGDMLTLSNIVANFIGNNVGNGKTVRVTGFNITGADAANYNSGTALATTANITPAPLTITASNASKIYGQPPTLSAFSQTGLANGETIGSVSETSPGTAATASVMGGPYAITPANAAGGTFTASNYAITYANGALAVTPSNLLVTAANATKNYGETPTLTAFSVAGLMNGDTIGAFTETSPGTAATASVMGSPYPISISSAAGGTFTASNYNIAYVNGTLTVTPQVQPLSILVASASGTASLLVNPSSPVWIPTIVPAELPVELQTIVSTTPMLVIPDNVPVEIPQKM